jgi:glycosyltransferase involved in cell wall biosynthesis
MNILHISCNDLAGGRFTGFYMQEFLPEQHNSEMAVWDKKSKSNAVHLIPPQNSILRSISSVIMKLGSRMGLDGLAGTGGWLLPFYKYFHKADIVHLHLIHGFSNFSILSLPLLGRIKPIVWTIHDPWATTGGCEHSFECEKWLHNCEPSCPYPRCRSVFETHTPFIQFKIKKWIYQRTNLTLVVASKWMAKRIEKSPLMSHFPCHLVPFGIDLSIFRPMSKLESRKKLGIEINHKVIAFRDTGLKPDKYKGMRWLLEALKIYEPKKPVTLLIFEDGKGFEILSTKYEIIKTGWIDGQDLVEALSAADIFLMPSIQETFGLMAVEAMACSTPVIVFEGTALPDVIKAPLGGLAVTSKNSLELSKAIDRLLDDDDYRNKLGTQARKIVEENYSIQNYISKHVEIYSRVMESHKNYF